MNVFDVCFSNLNEIKNNTDLSYITMKVSVLHMTFVLRNYKKTKRDLV